MKQKLKKGFVLSGYSYTPRSYCRISLPPDRGRSGYEIRLFAEVRIGLLSIHSFVRFISFFLYVTHLFEACFEHGFWFQSLILVAITLSVADDYREWLSK